MAKVLKSSDAPMAKITEEEEEEESLSDNEEVKTEEVVKKQPEKPKSNPTVDRIAVLQKKFTEVNNECIQASKKSDEAKEVYLAAKDVWHIKLREASNAQGALLSFKLSIFEQTQAVLLKKLKDAGISVS